MKKAIILAVVIIAVAAVIGYKFIGDNQLLGGDSPVLTDTPSPATNQADSQRKTTFYLFHDPQDQDASCRRIYAFADQAEKEHSERVEVKRPDIKTEKAIADKYQVRVLPTIILVAPDGQIAERFEGEDGDTIKQLESLMARLKTTE